MHGSFFVSDVQGAFILIININFSMHKIKLGMGQNFTKLFGENPKHIPYVW